MYEHRDDIPPSPPDADPVHRGLRWGLLGAVALTLLAAIPGGMSISAAAAVRRLEGPHTDRSTGRGKAAGARRRGQRTCRTPARARL